MFVASISSIQLMKLDAVRQLRINAPDSLVSGKEFILTAFLTKQLPFCILPSEVTLLSTVTDDFRSNLVVGSRDTLILYFNVNQSNTREQSEQKSYEDKF